MNYYIADTHFGHENIIRISHRPFSSIQEMDETLIKNWNKVVKPTDDVYILGDLAYKGKDPDSYIRKLNGRKHLITGNHDGRITGNPDCRKLFVEIRDMKTITDGGQKIVLCHYPMVEWDGYFRGVLHFYGHVHNNYENQTCKYLQTEKKAFNVGVDMPYIDFTPRTLKEIISGRESSKY